MINKLSTRVEPINCDQELFIKKVIAFLERYGAVEIFDRSNTIVFSTKYRPRNYDPFSGITRGVISLIETDNVKKIRLQMNYRRQILTNLLVRYSCITIPLFLGLLSMTTIETTLFVSFVFSPLFWIIIGAVEAPILIFVQTKIAMRKIITILNE